MRLAAGDHLRSQVGTTQVVVVKVPATEVDVACGGAPMLAKSDAEPAAPTAFDPGEQPTLLGKRYADEELGIELLCVKGGPGALTVNGLPLLLKEARSLPASD